MKQLLLFVFLTCFFIKSPTHASADSATRPNILLVLLDDMGYSDLGCYGGEIRTPVIDRLAASGVRLARFYNGAQCCPSRASLLTGLHPHQTGMGDMNPQGRKNAFWLQTGNPSYTGFKDSGIVTVAEVLREAGYQTFMSGKWHLADDPEGWPGQRGFERTFSLIHGASEHFTGFAAWRDSGPIAPFSLNGKRLEELPADFYSTDTFTNFAIQFIGESEPDRPWFGYLAYTAPHWPIQAHESDIARYEGLYDIGPESIRKQRFERLKAMGLVREDAVLPELRPEISQQAIKENAEEHKRWMQTYAAMIDCVDQNLGRVVQLLRERGELDNTLILLMSDNGADNVRGPLWGQASNAPFRESKVWVHEGGIASPMIAHWPDGIPSERAGAIQGGYAHFIDVVPTIYEVAAVRHPEHHEGNAVLPVEGISLIPALRGEAELPGDRLLYWERQGNEAVRKGDWKLVRPYNNGLPNGNPDGLGPRSGQWELYNLANDPGETRDLSNLHPERVASLQTAFENWADRVGVIPREQVAQMIRERIRK